MLGIHTVSMHDIIKTEVILHTDILKGLLRKGMDYRRFGMLG